MSNDYPRCTHRLRLQGVAYPRTCQECGLGPCKTRRLESQEFSVRLFTADEVADQLRQHEARVREQIAGEIAKLPLPETLGHLQMCSTSTSLGGSKAKKPWACNHWSGSEKPAPAREPYFEWVTVVSKDATAALRLAASSIALGTTTTKEG